MSDRKRVRHAKWWIWGAAASGMIGSLTLVLIGVRDAWVMVLLAICLFTTGGFNMVSMFKKSVKLNTRRAQQGEPVRGTEHVSAWLAGSEPDQIEPRGSDSAPGRHARQ